MHRQTAMCFALIVSLPLGWGAAFLHAQPTAEPAKMEQSTSPAVRIGYFHGGRVNVIYRTSVFGFFDQEGVPVDLYTTNLRNGKFYKMPRVNEENLRIKEEVGESRFGKVRGNELVDAMLSGEVDAGTIGESSFIKCANRGDPIVAVALLGFDTKEHPGHCIVMRKGVVIRTPADFHGKTLLARRAGPGDYIFLKEFLRAEGLADDKTIKVVAQVPDDEMDEMVERGEADGGYFHLMSAVSVVKHGGGWVYRQLNWVNPEMSQALLVFRKDFVRQHPDLVQKVVDAYVKRIAYEKSLPSEKIDKTWEKGTMMQSEFQGMMIPQYALPPLVRPDLLEAMQELLVRYGFLKKKKNMNDFIDNGFVENTMKRLGIPKQ